MLNATIYLVLFTIFISASPCLQSLTYKTPSDTSKIADISINRYNQLPNTHYHKKKDKKPFLLVAVLDSIKSIFKNHLFAVRCSQLKK